MYKALYMANFLLGIYSVMWNTHSCSHTLKVHCKPLMLVGCLSISASTISLPIAFQNVLEMVQHVNILGLSMWTLGIWLGLSEEEHCKKSNKII